ncbi:MAG: 16S rRNA (cytidine(1402)-2'-O)-methyltransferase [Bacillota bacterium]|nr:MAG: 16S rRNA (cytidine(1402)-2'-O)-methyltransferase [Bacillota bacterium]
MLRDLARAVTAFLEEPADWIAPGTLYVCGGPIGNMGDASLRLLQVLVHADRVLAEDTRHSRRLLERFGIAARLVSCHEHNEERRAAEVIRWLRAGEVVALLTDAGTPGVADPGARIVAAVAGAGLPVSPVPGPSAAMAALSVSGFGADRYLFEGFLPRDPERRRARIASWRAWPGPVVFFEAPHRLGETLGDLARLIPDGRLVLARELTKRFEEIRYGRVADLVAEVSARPARGEYTLVLLPPRALKAHAAGGAPGGEVAAGAPPIDDGTVGGAPGADGLTSEEVPVLEGGEGEALGEEPAAAATEAGPREATAPVPSRELLVAEIDLLVRHGLPASEAIRRVARGHGLRRADVYRLYHRGK